MMVMRASRAMHVTHVIMLMALHWRIFNGFASAIAIVILIHIDEAPLLKGRIYRDSAAFVKR
jgi:hypothetical protein